MKVDVITDTNEYESLDKMNLEYMALMACLEKADELADQVSETAEDDENGVWVIRRMKVVKMLLNNLHQILLGNVGC